MHSKPVKYGILTSDSKLQRHTISFLHVHGPQQVIDVMLPIQFHYLVIDMQFYCVRTDFYIYAKQPPPQHHPCPPPPCTELQAVCFMSYPSISP